MRRHYFAVYRKRTGRILHTGRCAQKGKVIPGRGESVAYSRSPVSAEKHFIGASGQVCQKAPVAAELISMTDTSALYRLPGGCGLAKVYAGVLVDGETIEVARTRHARRVQLRHPDQNAIAITVPGRSRKVKANV